MNPDVEGHISVMAGWRHPMSAGSGHSSLETVNEREWAVFLSQEWIGFSHG